MKTAFFRTRQGLMLVALAVIAAIVVVAGLASRRSQATELKQEAQARAVPTVTLATPLPASSAALELPARIEPWARAPIYARVSGYLKSWQVDIGVPVKAGQLLGQIDSPDIDQQFLQAKAELAVARSNLALSTSTAERWKGLVAADAVSRQEADEKAGDLVSRQSSVSASQANVDRLLATQGFLKLVAPFDGVVTERNTDVGALISIGGAASPLFVVSDLHRLRVYVSVPQRQVTQIRVGDVAELNVPERPGQHFAAKVASLSQAINTASGTMLVQLSVDNAKGELLPGGYATVRFTFADGGGSLAVAPGAVIFGKNGPHVAVVDAKLRVHLTPVTVARDLGNVIELASGVGKDDRIIESPPDGLADGDAVELAAPARKAAP